MPKPNETIDQSSVDRSGTWVGHGNEERVSADRHELGFGEFLVEMGTSNHQEKGEIRMFPPEAILGVPG